MTTPDSRTQDAFKQLLLPAFTTASMAPLDRETIEAFYRFEREQPPRRWVLADMGIMGLACWQGGMALLSSLGATTIEAILPDLKAIGYRMMDIKDVEK